MSSVFVSNYRCEQLFSLMNNVKSRTRTRLTDEHLEGCMRIAMTQIKPDTDRLIKQKQCLNISLMADFVLKKINTWTYLQ
jgi:hypothetical protein